jgi:hypothetical protein
LAGIGKYGGGHLDVAGDALDNYYKNKGELKLKMMKEIAEY